MKKLITPLLTVCLAIALFSCSNSTEKKDEPTKTTDTTVAAAPVAPPAFTPFDVVEITHKVKDYTKWKPMFDADSTARKANGLQTVALGRRLENSNDIMVVLKASDIQKAKAFGADPRLKTVMEKSGVISKPDMELFHIIRIDTNSHEKQWVALTHKVKDFAAWLKVFDNEGTASRASYGLIDVVLARGIEDSNVVHIVFDIKDMAKAKARINDPALKKLMMDGGVIGTPKIEFYKDAE